MLKGGQDQRAARIWETWAEVSRFLRAVCRSQLPSGSPSNTLGGVVVVVVVVVAELLGVVHHGAPRGHLVARPRVTRPLWNSFLTADGGRPWLW